MMMPQNFTIKHTWQQVRELPIPLILLTAVIALIGIAFIHSSSNNINESTGMLSHYATKQILWVTIGGMFFLVVALVDYHIWTKRGLWLFGACVGLMIACMVFGRNINGAKSWIVFGPLSLQVSEVCKPMFILMLAGMLRFRPEPGFLTNVWRMALPISALGVMLVLLLLQPDFGTAMLFVPTFLAMCWLSGASTKAIVGLMTAGASLLPALYLSGLFKSHQMSRIDTWLAILTGAPVDRSGDAYQVTMSMSAIGSGGMTGRGYGNSLVSQGEFLPERHTDFIFSVMAEETGFLGCMVVVFLLAALSMACLWIALRAQDTFGRLVAAGVGTLLMVQSLINLGMVCGLLPVTGLPIPLISYGGSSLIATMVSLGLVASVHLHPRRAGGLGGRR